MHRRIATALKVINHNRGLKLLALLLAAGAWYAIRDVTSFEARITDIPLHIQVDPGWAVLDVSSADADVLFRGSQQDIRNLNRDQVAMDIDLRGKSVAGSVTVNLDKINIRVPGGARPVDVDPGEVTISLDREADKMVPVKAEIVGTLPEGMEVEKIVCTPASVVIHGPERRLQEINVINTDPIDLEGRLRSFQLTKRIQQPGENWKARIEPERARVEVSLIALTTRKEFSGVAVQALMAPSRRRPVSINPASVKVVVEGTAEAVQELDPGRILAFVDCGTLEDGKPVSLPVRLSLNPSVQLISIEPPLVDVEIASSLPKP